jgi:hypothetical protein
MLGCMWPLAAQTPSFLTKTISKTYSETTLYDMLLDLEQQYAPIRICVEPTDLPWYKVSASVENQTLHETMNEVLTLHGLVYITLSDSMIGVCKKSDVNTAFLKKLRQRCRENRIEQPKFLQPTQLNVALGTAHSNPGQANVVFRVFDATTGEPIAGANLVADAKALARPTQSEGETQATLNFGSYNLTVDYIGYLPAVVQLELWENGRVNIPLTSYPTLLKEIQISGNKADNKTKDVQTAVEVLPVQTIQELPAFLGEPDVLKSLQVLPGVTSAGEGSSGINVRGGNIDQNLTLQDQVPLFSTAHVLGLFSVYNTDLVQQVTLYKGYVPPRFGGRTASVLDVRLSDGDFGQYHGQVGLGLATGKVSLEGPIVRNKVSFIGGYRRSYVNWLLRSINQKTVNTSSANFDDATLKVTARLGARSTLSVGAFQSSDELQYSTQFGYAWGNRNLNFALRNPLGERLISVLQGSVGEYKARYFVPEGTGAFELNNGLRYANGNWRVVFTPNRRHEINSGVQWERIVGQPERLNPFGDNSAVLPASVRKDRGESVALFVEDEFKFYTRWTIAGGLRAVFYRQFGAGTQYRYAPDSPILPENIVDSTVYGNGATWPSS